MRYAETDQMGIVYHANYLVWFEVGRAEFMRARGLPYPELSAQGLELPVIEASCRYRAPARYDDQLTVATALDLLRSTRLRFRYEVYRGQKLLATGTTEHAFVNRQGRPVNLAKKKPELWRQLERLLGTPAGEGKP